MSDPRALPEAAPAGRAARVAVEVAPAVLVLALLLYAVREILSPLVLFPLLAIVLWPNRSLPVVRRLLLATAALTTLWLLYVTGSLLAPFVLGLAFAYLLAPAVAWMEGKRMPRWLASLLVLLPFLAALVLLIILLVPAIERQVVYLAGRLPILLQRIADWLIELRTRFLATSGGLLSEDQASRLRNLQAGDLVQLVEQRWQEIGRRIWAAFIGLGRGVGTALTIAGYVVLTPVITYYFLTSWARFTGRIEGLVPPARRLEIFGFLGEYDRLLGRYIRGQLTEATLVAVLTGGTLALLGFPGALLVGVIAGLGNLIPYVGLPLSVLPAILLALVSGSVWASLLKVGAVFFVVQFIDGSITGPRIVGESVGLNPLWVMVALALFGWLLGFVGLLVAVPLAVLIKQVAEHALARYRASELYAGTAAPSAAP